MTFRSTVSIHPNSWPFRAKLALGLGLIVCAIAIQQFAALPVNTAFSRSLSNWMHVPLFAGITAVAMWLWPKRPFWQLGIGLLALAILSELVQFFTGREPSLVDLLKDVLGIAVTRLMLGPFNPLRIVSWILLVLCITLAVPGSYVLSYAYQNQSFPLLFTPADWRSRHLIRTIGTDEVTKAHRWRAYQDQAVLAVTWGDVEWPGVHVQEPVGNWGQYHSLRIDAFNPEKHPQSITVAVRHVGSLGTARAQEIELQPGANALQIPLARLAFLDNGEHAKIRRLILHTDQQHAGRRMLLGKIWLEKTSTQLSIR